MERLSGLDASFLYLETPTLHMHVVMTAVFDPSTMPGGYSFPDLRQRIAERIPLAPVFQRRLVEVPLRLGHPIWVDDPEFDIDNHLRRAALPAPGGIHELAEFTAEVDSRQLHRDRPLWEIWIVEGVAGDGFALVAKMHHSTIDGVSGAELLGVLFDLAPEPDPGDRRPLPAGRRDDHIPSSLALASQAVVAHAVRPVELTRQLWRTGQAVLGVRRLRQRPDAGRAALPLTAPRVSFNTAVSARRRVAFAAISLDDVKRLKRARGTTVNDVVLAICAGALRSYLRSGDELPDAPLVAVVPVSVRPDGLPRPGTNKISGMFVQVPTNEPDPLVRLETIQQGTKGAKEEHRALGADTLREWAEHATPNLFALAARLYTGMRLADRHRPIANLVISNVPGPDVPLYFGGGEMRAGFPLGPVMDGMGLHITIMSYRGTLYWGLVSCARAVPRLWDVAAAVPAALAELLQAAGLEPATVPAAGPVIDPSPWRAGTGVLDHRVGDPGAHSAGARKADAPKGDPHQGDTPGEKPGPGKGRQKSRQEARQKVRGGSATL